MDENRRTMWMGRSYFEFQVALLYWKQILGN